MLTEIWRIYWNLSKPLNLRTFFVELTKVDINEESDDNTVRDDICYTLYITENRRHECTRFLIQILDHEIFTLVDTGCELSAMKEYL